MFIKLYLYNKDNMIVVYKQQKCANWHTFECKVKNTYGL